jgi:uncharacterized membrane protein YbhN (UPF0104 family)
MNFNRNLSLLVLFIALIGIAFFIYSQPQMWLALKSITVSTGIYLVSLRFLFLATNGLFLQIYAEKFKIRLSLREWLGIPFVTAMGNFITPFSGGLVFRASYLKYRHDLPFSQFMTLLVFNYLITFWLAGVVGLVSLLFFVEILHYYWQVLFLFIIFSIVPPLLMLFPDFRLPWRNRFVNSINTSLEGWALVKNDRLMLFKLILLTLVNIVLDSCSFWLAFRALGFPISFSESMLISLLMVFSLLINITPGNIGVQEAIISLSSTILGASLQQGLVAALIVRVSTIILTFSLGPIFSYLLSMKNQSPTRNQA